MAYTYYETHAFSGGWHDGRIGVEVVSQSVSGNYSTVNLVLQAKETVDSSTYNLTGSASEYIKVDGTSKVTDNMIDFRSFATGTWYTILSVSNVRIYHTSDGTKTALIQGYCYTGVGAGTYNQTTSVTLPAIPRKSTASVTSSVEVNGTNQCTATITRYDTSFTHTVTFYTGDFATTSYKQAYTSVATSQAYAIPLTWMNSIPNSTSGSAKVRVETFDGSTSLGYNEYTFTITVPSTVIPVVTDIAFARDTTGSDPFNFYVNGFSKVNVTGVTLTNQYSATTANYSYGVHLGANAVSTGQLYTETTAAFITDEINTAGSMKISVRTLDSRGRYSAWYGESFTVYDYFSPSLTVTGERCTSAGVIDPSGDYINLRIQATVSAVNNDNTADYTLEFKKTTDSSWTSVDVTALADSYAVDSSYVRSASSSYSWEVRASVTDKVGTVTKTAQVSTAAVLLDFLSGGTGIAIGKVAEIAGFEVALDTVFGGTVDGGGLLSAADSSKKYKIVACVIENDGASNWQLIADPHSSINVSSVTSDASTINVNYSFTASKVISFVACPDEMFARNGYMFGASVGTTSANISVGRSLTLGGYIAYNGSSWTYSGTGISGVTFSSGTITVTHSAIAGVAGSANCRAGVYVAAMGAVGSTTTEIVVKDYAGATVTTATTDMKFYFTRSVSAFTPVTANTLNLAGANIWCFGIFEVS